MGTNTKIVKINKKQTKMTDEDGGRYKAAPVGDGGGCSGCAFTLKPCPLDESGSSRCSTSTRGDRTSIVWTPRKPKEAKAHA